MTKLLDKALDAVRRLPGEAKDGIARAMLNLAADDRETELVDSAHLSAVPEGLAHTKRREFASDIEIEAAFRRFEK
jgi:hypothetical protein